MAFDGFITKSIISELNKLIIGAKVNKVYEPTKNEVILNLYSNGKNYSLSSFGIGTLGYFTASEFEKGVFHIDGDPDDASSSGNDDKLKSMIAADPESVGEFFKNLASDLYTKVGEKMQATQLSSAFTVYNDKQMNTELTDIKKKISDWEDYVTEQEDYWYSKFAAMEKAMSELQSNSSYLSGLLGTA